MLTLQTLYQRNAKGDVEQWAVSVDGPEVIFYHGKLGGKQIKHSYTAEAVNVGKANARDPKQQAEFEAKAAWQKKIDREGYQTSVEAAKIAEVLIPMKAQKFKPKLVSFPIYVQPKLNGLRCFARCLPDGTVTLRSYGGVLWSIPHIEVALGLKMNPGEIFDGEVYKHGVPLQTLNSWVKNTERPERLALEFHMYDYPRGDIGNGTFHDRFVGLDRRLGTPDKCLYLVETKLMDSQADVDTYEKQVVGAGYEGLILRVIDGLYEFNARPKTVLKLKQFKDAQFEVIDMKSRVHKLNDVECTICDICVCRNDINDQTFEVVPKGTVGQKMEYWTNRESYIGQRMTVRYFERSESGIPQGNPVGLHFRLEEDENKEDSDEWA
jgi:hypothetical protein